MSQNIEQQRRLLAAGQQQVGRLKRLAALHDEDESIAAAMGQKDVPEIHEAIDAARLLKRYPESAPLDSAARAIRARLISALERWGLSEQDVNRIAKEAWQSGYRPPVREVEVGSGAM
jgi:hypothetical protein